MGGEGEASEWLQSQSDQLDFWGGCRWEGEHFQGLTGESPQRSPFWGQKAVRRWSLLLLQCFPALFRGPGLWEPSSMLEVQGWKGVMLPSEETGQGGGGTSRLTKPGQETVSYRGGAT